MSRFRTVLEDIEIIKPVKKHGEHDQKTHGNWSTGGTVYTSIIDRLGRKDVTGFSLDISSRSEPTSGYMCSNAGAEATVEYKDFFSSRDRSREILLDYIEKNADALSERGAYFGIWVVKDQGTVYLDVSRRYDSRGEAVRAGFDNDQQSVYDIEKDEYIYMKDEEDDRTNKSKDGGSSNPRQSDDPRGEASLRGGDSERDRKEPLESGHVCLGRYHSVEKHLEGQHDQATHGSWASGRFGPDSVKAARDGAKEYAFKAGIKQDDSIDYQKTVANRARAARIADAYDELPVKDEKAFESYTALATEVEAQFDYMTKTMGIKVEFVADDPYKTSREMFADVSKGVLKVLSTASTGSHPFFKDEQNDKFRAVHDFFGHAATGRGFGQDGEESAWVHHSQMFTETARAALTTETRGQNSWYNTRNQGFAEQKVALLPKEFWEVPATFEKSYKVIRFEAGLIPAIKHLEGQHDQSTHGSWANGYTAEEIARMDEMSNLGPALEDLDAIIDSMKNADADIEQLEMMVNNDASLFISAVDGIDEIWNERVASASELKEVTEQEKNAIYESLKDEMISNYISENMDDLQAAYNAEAGLGEVQELTGEIVPYFEEVYNTDHEVVSSSGDYVTTLKSEVTYVDAAFEDVGNGNQPVISVKGTITDDDGNFAGEFERYFYKQEGVWMVDHHIFKMDDDYKGLGFGKEFIQRQEDWYAQRGIGGITVMTGWDGARHWARSGYDWNPKNVEGGIRNLYYEANNSTDFLFGSPARVEFDALMERATNGYKSTEDGIFYDSVKSVSDNNFPLPNDFAMIGYKDKVSNNYESPVTGETKVEYTWAGQRLLQDQNLYYTKVLTAEGRNLFEGPIDRDGDGLVFDGTAREKPVSAVNS